jgi:hypothetical protein
VEAVERGEQEAMTAAVPEVPLLHGPQGLEACLRVLFVAVLDTMGRAQDALRIRR